MEKLVRVYFILTTLSLVFKAYSEATNAVEYKTWIPNTNWNNDQNWASGKVPCPLQDVQLDSPLTNSPLAIALTGETPLQSLSLPMNGELIFNKDAELTFFQDKEVVLDKCKEKGKIQFIATAPKMWYNPNNWQTTDIDGKLVSNEANAVLHMEKVPCQHDQVLFPKDSSFNVGSTQPITVASITINGQKSSQNAFRKYLMSDSGAMQFNLSKSVHLTGETCRDPMGCPCNTNKEQNAICGHVTCAAPQCSYPLKPSGSCCTYCGALIMGKPGASFRFHEFKANITSLTSKFVQGSTLVQVCISRVGDMIQVVFTDSAKGKLAQHLAENVADEISGSSDFTIAKRLQSGRASRSAARKDDSKSFAIGLGLGLGLLFMLILVIAVLICRGKMRGSTGRTRRRFGTGTKERMRSHSLRLSEDTLELQEMPPDAEKENDAEEQHATGSKYQALASDNLLYEGAGGKKTFENPLYESTSQENLTRDI